MDRTMIVVRKHSIAKHYNDNRKSEIACISKRFWRLHVCGGCYDVYCKKLFPSFAILYQLAQFVLVHL